MDRAAVDAASGQDGRQSTPLWMDASAPHVGRRRGAIPAPRSGLHTLLFFGLIIAAVSAAGIVGVAVWGPEKTVKNRTQFASNPQPPADLPTATATATTEPVTDPAPPAVAAEAAPGAESVSPAAATSAGKKAKKAPKSTGKKAH